MTQPTTASGRTLSQPLFVPTLMPMQSLSQQAVITSGSVGVSVVPASMTSVITSGSGLVTGGTSTVVWGGQAHTMTIASASSAQEQARHNADLYLCSTSRNATEPLVGDGDGDSSKPSIQSLEESYKELKSRNIKDTLSSFLLDMPGEFDGSESQDTTLRYLLEQRLVTRKDFHPLSGHALLGFRLLPGALPEQARIDPPLAGDSRSQHRKRKHKHRGLEKAAEEGNDYNTVSNKVKMPNDAFAFVKDSQLPTPIPTSVVSHTFTATQDRAVAPPSLSNLKMQSGRNYPQPTLPGAGLVGATSTGSHDPMKPFPGGKKKKKEKRNKEKKKDKKEKKKKKDKHHSQDPPSGQPPPPSASSSSSVLATHATNAYSIP